MIETILIIVLIIICGVLLKWDFNQVMKFLKFKKKYNTIYNPHTNKILKTDIKTGKIKGVKK